MKALVLYALAAVVGCRNPTAAGDGSACRQTYEFGNTGCFEVVATIVGSRGQPLSNVFIVARPVSDASPFTVPNAMTDTAGSAHLRALRMTGQPLVAGVSDTVSVFVVALDPRSAGVNVPASVRDSVRTVVTVAPVGTVPPPGRVHITLAVP